MELEIKSAFAGHHLRTFLLLLFALFTGPLLLWLVYNRAMTNHITDVVSWSVIVVMILPFAYLSFSNFKYVCFMLWGSYVLIINEYSKILVIYPDNHTVDLKLITELVYLKKQRRYVFRCDAPGCRAYSIEINRDMHLENEIIRLTALQKCKVE